MILENERKKELFLTEKIKTFFHFAFFKFIATYNNRDAASQLFRADEDYAIRGLKKSV